jgi:hypothetical protein
MSKVHANFQQMLQARKAVQALRDMGYVNAHLDAVEKFFDEHATEINVPGTHNAPSLSALVLKSRGQMYDIGKGPLMAANPYVSGVGSYNELSDDSNTRLIVSVEDDKYDEVKKLITELGGSFY